MKKTLILVVDRDDDFGVKAGVQTPAIGLDEVSNAANLLGMADPEDSDTNAAYAAIKAYNEMKEDGMDVEIALICGDTKVGHKSDIKIVDELETVIKKVAPERAILVSDGVEDEYVFPIITSRIKVDSVKKVYVKQAPGLEGTFYLLVKILRDEDKRKRLLAPIGTLMVIVTFIMMIPTFINYYNTGETSILLDTMGLFILFTMGLLLYVYAHGMWGRLKRFAGRIHNDIKSGDLTVIFSIVALALLCVGIVLGVFAAFAPQDIRNGERILIFMSNSLWIVAFAYICNDFGKFLEKYIEERKIVIDFLVGTQMIFAVAFIMQATLDSLAMVFGYNTVGSNVIIMEFIIGFVFAAFAGMTQMSYKRFLKKEDAAEQPDAIL
ncbi:MAG: DUF373 family protein [Methanomassiliicoccaceae archaeon]|nr:DUF373 family protein [Methanomassiliicoccaceae archaeon]